MRKKILYLFGTLLLVVCLIQPALASDVVVRLLDEADLLTDSAEAALSEKLDEISLRQKLDVVIVTINETGDRTAAEYADDIYDYSGYAEDGVLLLISVDDREWAVSTRGTALLPSPMRGLII